MPADVSQLLALAAKAATVGATANVAVAAAVAKDTQALAADARARAPKLTGALAASITGHSAGLVGLVEATARYAEFVEFGTGKGPPQPYMMPAADAAEARLGTDVENAVATALGSL